jgi:hypothetical protein
MRPARASALLAVAATAAAVAIPAQAADKPAPCGDYLLTDKEGDQSYDASGLGALGSKTPDNTDITGLYFTFRDGKLLANLEIKKLDKTGPNDPTATGGVWYYVVWKYKDVSHFVRAANRSGGDIEYRSGTVDSTGVYTTDSAPVTGQFIEGDKGVVSMEIPAAIGGKEGETLGLAGATVDYIQGADDAAGLNIHTDTTPADFNVSDPNGKNYKVEACSAGTPSGTPGATALPVKAAGTIGKAKKAKKGKSLSFSVTSTKPVTNLKVTLKAKSGKGKTLGSGKLASLDGSAKIKLKLSKTLKKGSYALLSSGTVDGATATAKQTVKIKA